MTRSNASPSKLREHPEISVGESLTYQTRTVVGPLSPSCANHTETKPTWRQAKVGCRQIRARHLRGTGIHNEDPRHQRLRVNVIRRKGADNDQLAAAVLA